MRVDDEKRLIPPAVLRTIAGDVINSIASAETTALALERTAEHLAGVIDAHCILLQRALCIHCGNGVPLAFVEKWGEWLHNGEVSCLSAGPMKIMGVDPESLHRQEDPNAS